LHVLGDEIAHGDRAFGRPMMIQTAGRDDAFVAEEDH